MNYNDYKNARDAAWQIIIDAKLDALPVDIAVLCRSLGIAVKTYTPTDGNDGTSRIIGGKPFIFVAGHLSKQRKRFTVAHELGHYVLGHVGEYALVNREPSPNDSPIEQAANVFASRILAPACVLWGCKVQTAEQLAELCDISQQAAEYRMARMLELYKLNKFLTSPLERKVFAQYADFIRRQCPEGTLPTL